MSKLPLTLLATAALCCSASAQATDYKYEFSASGFYGAGVPPWANAPAGRVSGSFIFSASAPGAAPTSFSQVNLVIDGHTYTVGEISFLANGSDLIVGASNNGLGIVAGTNDFEMMSYNGGRQGFLNYTSVNAPGQWRSSMFSGSIAEVSAVPEPHSWATLCAGLGLMGWLARRRKTRT